MAQFWKFPLNAPFRASAATTLASFTGPSDVWPAPDAPTLPANSMFQGLGLSIKAFGVLSAVSSATFNFGIYWGGAAGIALVTSGAQTPAATPVNTPWKIDVDLVCRAVGSGTAGSIIGQGLLHLGTSVSAVSVFPMPNTALAAVGVDTTTAKLLSVGVTCSASSASNTVTGHGLKVYADA